MGLDEELELDLESDIKYVCFIFNPSLFLHKISIIELSMHHTCYSRIFKKVDRRLLREIDYDKTRSVYIDIEEMMTSVVFAMR